MMEHKVTNEQIADVYCRVAKMEAIANFMLWVEPEKLYTCFKPKDLYQNFGEIIEEEAREIRGVITSIQERHNAERDKAEVVAIS